jgi:hypothetical protein
MRGDFLKELLDANTIPVQCLGYAIDACRPREHLMDDMLEAVGGRPFIAEREPVGSDELLALKSNILATSQRVVDAVRGMATNLQVPARILQFLLRYNIADLHRILESVPPSAVLPSSGWLGQPSVLVTALLDDSAHLGHFTLASMNAVTVAMSAILSHITDAFPFLFYFVVQLKGSSTVFRRYMDSQLGRVSPDEMGLDDAIDSRKHIALGDGTLQREILAVRNRLRVLARADVIPKAELVLIAKMLEHSNVYADVELLKAYFDERDDDPTIKCALPPTERLYVLRRVIRQLQVLDLINSMAAGLEKHGLGHLMTLPTDPMPTELIKLKEYLEEDRDNVTLTLVKPDSEYMAKFQALSAVQMELLKHCGRYADFKKWIADMKFFDEPGSNEGTERFNRMINYVTQLLQGESYDEEVLLALMESVPVMVMFRAPESLTALVSTIGQCQLPSLRRLNMVEKCLSQIQDWFDDNVSHTFGEVIAQLKAVMNDGRAVVRCLQLHAAVAPTVTLEIHFVIHRQGRSQDRVMTEEQLADFAQAVIFHASESVGGSQATSRAASPDTLHADTGPVSVASDVARFLEAIEVLREVRMVTQKLLADVHMVALTVHDSLRVCDVETNRSKLHDLQAQLVARQVELKHLRRAHPLLSCMLLPQILRVMERLQWCQNFAVGGDVDAPLHDGLRTELVSALGFCGVDASKVAFTNDMVLGDPFYDETAALAHMYRLGQWLDSIRLLPESKSLLVPAELCAPDIGHAKGSIGVFAVDAIDGTPVDVYNRIAGLYNGNPPHWSQLLWCTAATTPGAVTTFFERCESNTNAVYTMIAPHALSRDLWDTVQDTLLMLIHGPSTASGAEESKDSDVDMDSKAQYHRGPRCRLAVIFTKDCSTRRLCVNTISSDKLAGVTFKPRFTSMGVRLFVGRSGDGKSFSIAKHLAAVGDRFVTRIRVNEGFSVNNFLERYGNDDVFATALAEGTPMSFVLHVSAYAPFEEFDRFLFGLFVTGALWTPQSSRLVSLPLDLDVEVLVEIPNPVVYLS